MFKIINLAILEQYIIHLNHVTLQIDLPVCAMAFVKSHALA